MLDHTLFAGNTLADHILGKSKNLSDLLSIWVPGIGVRRASTTHINPDPGLTPPHNSDTMLNDKTKVAQIRLETPLIL